MNENGAVLPRHAFRSLNVDDINRSIEEHKRKNFGDRINLKLCDSLSTPKEPIEDQDNYLDDIKG